MAATKQDKAVKALVEAVDSVSFLPRTFGQTLVAAGWDEQTQIMKAFMGFVDAMCIQYDNNQYDIRNQQACLMAKRIKENMQNHAGWPVQF